MAVTIPIGVDWRVAGGSPYCHLIVIGNLDNRNDASKHSRNMTGEQRCLIDKVVTIALHIHDKPELQAE